MAQDDFLTFIERIKQVESRGQRYGKDGKLLTSPKGAQGEMQVMPATQRAPGFGVAPVKDNSPDEIARVGRDILRAFDAKYGGNRMYIAAAYNWGPGNADKWIAAGADFNKLPEETQKYLRKVVPEALTASRDQKAAPRATAVTEPAVMEPPLGISASAGGRTIAIGDSLAVGFAQANKLDGLHKGGAGPKAVLKMVQDYAANNSLEGVTVYLGTGLPNNPAQRDFVTKQVDLIKSKGGIPVLFGAGPGSEKTPTTGQNEFLQSVAQSTGAQFTGPLADRFPNISKQDRTGLHLTHPQYRQLFSQMGGAAPAASRPAAASPAPGATSTATAPAAPAAVAAAPVARAEDLGSGYKAALALSFLGSEDRDRPAPDSELEDRLNETALAEFNKELEDYTPKNALADMELTALNPAKFMQPVKMASGGMPFVPSARVSLSARKQLEDIKNQYDRYNDEVKAYSAAADVYNAGPRTEDFTMKEPVAPTVTQEQYDKIASDAKRSAINRQTALAVVSDPERYGLSINKFFADGGEAKKEESKNSSARTAREALDKVFGLGMGPMGMGANLGYNVYKHFSGKTPLEDLLRDARRANSPIDPTKDMEPIGQYGGMPPINRSNGSPETGERALTPEEIAAASRPATFNPNIARQGTAARNLAAQRDVNTLPDPRTYAAVSGFFGQAPDELGFSVMHPDIKGITTAGEAGYAAGLVPAVAPVVAPIARAVKKGATALGMRAEKALDAPVTRTLEGGGRSAEMLRALGAQPSFAVRPKGGHFQLRPDASGPGMAVWDDVKQTVSDLLANTKDQPLNNWFNTKYAAYLRRDLGTEGDPFVKAADAGKKLHIPNQPLDENWQKTLNFVRKNEGLPPQGFATTEYGKRVEDSLDASLNIRELGDLAGSPYSLGKVPSGIMQFANTNPQMRIYSLDEILETGPRAGDLRDRMLFLRQNDKVRFYGEPPVKIPDTYKITDQALLGMSPVQASEKVAQFENWQQNIRQRAASSAIRKDPNVEKIDAGDGSLWINTPDLGADEKMRELVKDIGRDARWCTKDDKFCYAYGSGNSRLTILVDGKSRPVAQMTIDSIPPTAEKFLKSLSPEELNAFMSSNPLYKFAQDKKELASMMETSPQFAEYLKRTPPRMSITEIKGWGNRENLVDLDAPMTAENLKKIQDRVKTLDAQYDLRFVENLSGIGLTEVPRNRPDAILDFFSLSQDARLGLKNKFGSDVEGFKAILNRAINMNGGSKYFSGNEDDISDIFQKATRSVLQPPVNRAKGGMVERTYNDNRAYL